ncbi:MAG: serine/threonine protein kinase [Verrucomicrobia bacterium]|nr:serine/threonine protein kinase [Verrucomicrobiota bacterium]
MGEVYRARDLTTGQIVALKLLYPFLAGNITYLQRFQAEAEAARRLDHPNLVKVFRSDQSGLTHFICMEFVAGTNLSQLLSQEGALSEATTAAIGMCVASALHHAWEIERLIHRDIKPENIVVSHAGDVKVCDLGIAKRMLSGVPALTRTGLSMGSPHYIAPEQARGEKQIDMRVDIYALGATLYHTATGQTVHQADSEFGLMIKHATEPVKDPRTIAPWLSGTFAGLLTRMLDLDRDRRPADWCAVYDELLAIYEQAGAAGAQDRPQQLAIPQMAGAETKMAVA